MASSARAVISGSDSKSTEMTSAANGPSKLKATTFQPKKKSGFYVYMEEEKSFLEDIFEKRMTMAEVSQSYLMQKIWKNLSPERKLEYAEKAKQYNEQVKADALRNPPQKKKACNSHAKEAEAMEQLQQNREIVWNLFSSEDWSSKTIVVCTFSTYFHPRPRTDEKYVPAEIGMTAFSLQNGVIDNYGRIIDPTEETIPMNRRLEVIKKVDELGIPAVGSCKDFQNYNGLLIAILGFLQKHCDKTLVGGTFYVFALKSDLESTAACLEWIFEAAGCGISVKVLDLSLYAHVASTVNNPEDRKISDEELAAIGPIFPQLPVMQDSDDFWSHLRACVNPPSTSANRTVGKPFNKCFVHPSSQPLTRRGVFKTESDVDGAVKASDNYRYYSELCCTYHMKCVDGAHCCALLSSNRYAFSLLEILTMSYKVDAFPGYHFPTVTEPEHERQRRCGMLSRWGITRLEERLMADEGAVLEENATRDHDLRRQRRQFERLEREKTSKQLTEEQKVQREKDEQSRLLSAKWPWAKN